MEQPSTGRGEHPTPLTLLQGAQAARNEKTRREDPRTNQNYKVSQLDAIRNKAHAMLGGK